MLKLAMLTEEPTHPTMFNTGIKDLAQHISLAESILIMNIYNRAIRLPTFGITADTFRMRVAFLLPAVKFFFPVFFYVLGLNFV